jgi:hypothetical protein
MSTVSYLIVQDYHINKETRYATMGHLLVFNPTNKDANLKVTFYYEDEEPTETYLTAKALRTNEWNWDNLSNLKKYKRFAMQVISSEPVVTQATIGWNNKLNNYSLYARNGERETAMSYLGITQLSKIWYYADGIVIDSTDMWVRESEWNIILNPADKPAKVMMTLFFRDGSIQNLEYTIQARRISWIYMDDVVTKRNILYGTRIKSTEPIVVQHLRVVYWIGKKEDAYWTDVPVMAFWSAPFSPSPLTWAEE